jgi:hypothetical protein
LPPGHAPVAFFIFNRPRLTERVFREIARARPSRLLIIADGPRPDVSTDDERVREARAIVERIDWPCEVSRHYSDINLGCGRRVASGLQWVFDQVDRAIILEDDTVPAASFFEYATAMLERYADDERVVHVAGTGGFLPDAGVSYLFSTYASIWGWATWRRAWRHYDYTLSDWPARRRDGWLDRVFADREDAAFWRHAFDRVHASSDGANPAVTWDTQWMYACWTASGLSVVPTANLIANIGCGPDATHTTDPRLASTLPALGELPSAPLLRHPPRVARSEALDALMQRRFAGVLS